MKKIITLTLALLASGSTLFAQGGRSNAPLQLRLTDNSPVTVSVDGANYANEGGLLSINNVAPGEHEIQVFRGALREGAKVPVLKTFRVTTTEQGTTYCIVDPVSGTVDIQAGRGGDRGDRGERGSGGNDRSSGSGDRGSGGEWGGGDRTRGDRGGTGSNGTSGTTGNSGSTGTTGTSGTSGNTGQGDSGTGIGTTRTHNRRDVFDPADATTSSVKIDSRDFNKTVTGQRDNGTGMQGSTGSNNAGNNGATGNENGRTGNGQNDWGRNSQNNNNNNNNNNNGYTGGQQVNSTSGSYNNGSTQYGSAQSNGNGSYQQGQNWNNGGNQQGQNWNNGGYNGQNDRGGYQGNGGYANQNDRWGNQGGWNNDGRGTHRRWQGRDRDDRNNDRWNDDRRYNDRNNDRRYDDRDNDDRGYEAPEPELVLLKAKDIATIKAKVAKKTTDAAKNTLLQAEIGDRAFTVEQGRGMLRLLKGETERLKFARWAIDATIDVENFAKLATEFKLAASKREIKKLAEEAAQD